MRIAYLDTIGGIAGDMTMAACVSAGLPLEELSAELRKLSVGGFELMARHVKRNTIEAVHIDVEISQQPHYHRHLKDIHGIIDASDFPSQVKQRAKAVFDVIAAAEAKIHGTTIEKVHFHEVGALDSIVDIVGTAICFEKLNVEQIWTSPVRLGSGGLVNTQHGTMPTPTPATLEILKGYPTVLTSIPHELTTPTGAGIVKALSSGVMSEHVMTVREIGYGAGTAELPQVPNFLRLIVGEIESSAEGDEIVMIETNIDDMNPQVYPHLIEKLIASGALDAYLTPVIMKKGRPGMQLSVIAQPASVNAITDLLYAETSTIGLRVQNIGRRKLPRKEIQLHTSLGTVRAKAVIRNGKEIIAPEFEECRRIAQEKQIPLVEVMRIIEREISSGSELR